MITAVSWTHAVGRAARARAGAAPETATTSVVCLELVRTTYMYMDTGRAFLTPTLTPTATATLTVTLTATAIPPSTTTSTVHHRTPRQKLLRREQQVHVALPRLTVSVSPPPLPQQQQHTRPLRLPAATTSLVSLEATALLALLLITTSNILQHSLRSSPH